jgi:SnoaL-like domain
MRAVEQLKTVVTVRVILVALSIIAFGAPGPGRRWCRHQVARGALCRRAQDKRPRRDHEGVRARPDAGRLRCGPAAAICWRCSLPQGLANIPRQLRGPVTVELTDLDVAADRNLAYSHSIQHVAGTDKQGKKLDLTVRVTDVYKKARGRWLIIHEHVSVPVDLDAGKPDLSSKP